MAPPLAQGRIEASYVRTAIAHQQRVAVGSRLGDPGAANGAGSGADILHHNRLTQDFAERQGLQPRAGVNAAARRKWHDQSDGAGRPVRWLRCSGRCKHRKYQRRRQ
jgi:hypothetical protein